MAVPTVYRWDDASAPQLTDYRDYTQLKALIQAVFVDGYGAKSGMGWGMTTDDPNHEIVLTQGDIGTGVQCEVHLDYTQRVNSDYLADYAQFWDTNAVNQIGTNIVTEGYSGIGGYNDDQLKVIPWIIVGTNRSFYAFSGTNDITSAPTIPTDFASESTKRIPCAFFGDYVPSINDINPHNQVWTNQTGNINSHSTTSRASAEIIPKTTQTSTHWILSRDFRHQYIATYSTTTGNLASPYVEYAGLFGYHRENPLKYPYLDGGLYMEPVYIFSGKDGAVYGKIPGLYIPLHDAPLKPSSGESTFDGTGEFDGRQFICISSATYELYIDITSDWAI